MHNPRLRHLPSGKNAKTIKPRASLAEQSPDAFDTKIAKFSNLIRQELGDDWVLETPQISPARIIKEASNHPFRAAQMCQQACIILNAGHHERVHQYMIAAYVIAGALRGNDLHISFVADKIKDGRSSAEGIPIEKFKNDIIHYVFVYIFAQSGVTKRNRAWQWADSLEAYFDDSRDAAEVEQLLKMYGQNKLRLAALTAKNERSAHRRFEGVENTFSKHVDSILAKKSHQDEKSLSPASDHDGITEFGPRDIPPSEHMMEDDGSEDSTSGAWRGDTDGRAREGEEQEGADNVSSVENGPHELGSIDKTSIDEILEKILLSTMSLGVKLTEPDLKAEQQKQLLPMVVWLSVEIVELRRMLLGR